MLNLLIEILEIIEKYFPWNLIGSPKRKQPCDLWNPSHMKPSGAPSEIQEDFGIQNVVLSHRHLIINNNGYHLLSTY